MGLTNEVRARIEAMLGSHQVVLFMKGTRTEPRCGFSASVVSILDRHLLEYATFDVLADDALREAIKVYAEWPTLPQLYIDGQFVGGADIVAELDRDGALQAMLDVAVAPPDVQISDAAAAVLRAAAESGAIRLDIDAGWKHDFALDERRPGDTVLDLGGLVLLLDRVSAGRANGLRIEYVEDEQGAGLVIDNPNEPAQVVQLSPQELRAALDRGAAFQLVDVRTPAERAFARIEGSRLLDGETEAFLESLPRDTALVFQCHHGVRSQAAAMHFAGRGFRRVYNLTGGIDAWSRQVDPTVPRY